MKTINVNFNNEIGPVKPLHGVGQPPFSGLDFSMFHYLSEAGIPFSRLHDVGGNFGGNMFVDVPNIFRDFSKDPLDPANYDFGFTDRLITALVDHGVEPFFRLGVTIENYCAVKAYRIFPPADNMKWARVCEGIIRHYTEGWADGFRYNIRYWEIWNEPDNDRTIPENQMWWGSKEQFYDLYVTAATYLKSRFPSLKIGGYASCGFYALFEAVPEGANASTRYDYFIEFFDGFLNAVKASGAPLDFFSWHSYDSIENNISYAKYAKSRLADAGFSDTEIFCNEWNYRMDLRGTKKHAALILGMLLTFAYLPLDGAMFYDARLGVSIYGSLFNPLTREPFPALEAFSAFNELYKAGTLVSASSDLPGVYVAAAKGPEGKTVVIANTLDTVAETNYGLLEPDSINIFH